MTRLFRSKSWEFLGRPEFSRSPPSPFFYGSKTQDQGEDELDGDDSRSPISKASVADTNHSHFAILDTVVAALKKSLVTCSVGKEDDSSLDISWPTEVRHVSHVTFDRLHGFLGLPSELEPGVPISSNTKVFGVSVESMECSYDDRGNRVPTILLTMQKQLYSEGGLKVEGIFRINAESSQEEFVRDQLNRRGVVQHGSDVHCLSGLIKAWFRERPTRVLGSLTPEQVANCNTEEDCSNLVQLLPSAEAALLHWVINLMTDVVKHEEFNKMNAHNIAVVFAPNMTEIADPLTALVHAVQVMNFLKTLILKVLRERDESKVEVSGSPSFEADPFPLKFITEESCEQNEDSSVTKAPFKDNFLRTSTLGRIEWSAKEKLWSSEEIESLIDDSTPSRHQIGAIEYRYRRYDGDHWLRLRKKIQRLWRQPVFLLSKASKKCAT